MVRTISDVTLLADSLHVLKLIGSDYTAFRLGYTAYFVQRMFSDTYEYRSWLNIDLSSSSIYPGIATCRVPFKLWSGARLTGEQRQQW